jgi:RNA polymerase sigma-70 factor (ECF subfamily)
VRFDTTHWSLVLAAGGDDSSAARGALGALCELYWYPLYAYVRRRGHDPDDARDLTQAFFTSLLARRSFDDLAPERGRFRAFLLAALAHFLSNDAARRHALKRGGGVDPRPLGGFDAESAERLYAREPAGPDTPESIFERRWALAVIDRVLGDLRAGYAADGREAEFDRLKACLLGEGPAGGYDAVAAELGTTPGAVKTAAHRLRRRFQSHLRDLIAHTVADPAEVDDEIRHLIRSLG